MSKVSSQELDLQIQLSLVAKIRQAAQRYKNDPAESGSTALQSYIAALEGLADHIDIRCRGSRLFQEAEAAARRTHAKQPQTESGNPRTERVIPFPGASPSNAA